MQVLPNVNDFIRAWAKKSLYPSAAIDHIDFFIGWDNESKYPPDPAYL